MIIAARFRSFSITLLFFALLGSSIAYSEDQLQNPELQSSANAVHSPAPSSDSSSSKLQISGLFDFYYSYNKNRPRTPSPISSTSVPSASIPNGNNQLRYYDIYHNQIALNLAELTLRKTSPEVSFLVDLDFGGFADQNAAVASPSTAPTNQVVDEVSKHIGQAFITYTPSSAPNLTIEIGKMPTHVGYELMKPRDNWQYSRSTAFGFGGPFWHTGIHVGYAVVPQKLIPSLYIYNSWNSIYDNNSGKTLGAQLKMVPSNELSVIYNFIGGPEQAGNNANYKTIHEINTVYTLGPKTAFALELLAGHEKNALIGSTLANPSWRAMSLHAKFQLSPAYTLSPRFEVFRDTHGYTVGGPSQTIYGYTLTNGFTLATGLETRLEFRYDDSTYRQRFEAHDGTTKSQLTGTLGVIYSL